MDHQQLSLMAQQTAADISQACERFCRAVMLFEQSANPPKTINIPEELSHAGLVNMTNRLHEIEREVAADPENAREILRRSLPEAYQSSQPELAPPVQPVHLPQTKPSEPTLASYMDKTKPAQLEPGVAGNRDLLRETIPQSAQGERAPVYPSGPQTFEQVEARQQQPAAAPVNQQVKSVKAKENVWKHFLSPKVAEGGQGVLQPGFKDLQLYNADLDLVSSNELAQANWPSGFYSAKKESTDVYFLFNGAAFFLRVRISGRRPVQQLVLFKSQPSDGWLPLADELMYEFSPNSDVAKIYREILNWAKVS